MLMVTLLAVALSATLLVIQHLRTKRALRLVDEARREFQDKLSGVIVKVEVYDDGR